MIKNPSLLLKQIYAHTESYTLKLKLVRLLIERYPLEEDILDALNEIKIFTKFANHEEDENNITLVRQRAPVIDEGTLEKTFSMYSAMSDRNLSMVGEEYAATEVMLDDGPAELEVKIEEQADREGDVEDDQEIFEMDMESE